MLYCICNYKVSICLMDLIVLVISEILRSDLLLVEIKKKKMGNWQKGWLAEKVKFHKFLNFVVNMCVLLLITPEVDLPINNPQPFFCLWENWRRYSFFMELWIVWHFKCHPHSQRWSSNHFSAIGWCDTQMWKSENVNVKRAAAGTFPAWFAWLALFIAASL